MSSLLNPLHPGTLFIQKKLGQQSLLSYQLTLPPGATITFQVVPPSGRVWIGAIQRFSIPRDAATNNPVISPNLILYGRHSMVVSSPGTFGLESFYSIPWGVELDIKVNDPAISTIINGTALTVVFDVTLATMEITEDKYDQYMRLWNGLYNFERLIGSLTDKDVDSLISFLKTFQPVVPLPTPLPTEEVTTQPTMYEDTGKPIKRIDIP